MKTEVVDRTLAAFKKLVPHMRGALWWAENNVIKERVKVFNQKDGHQGHPVLSIRRDEVSARTDAVPMLVGTSGFPFDARLRAGCIDIVGMTKIEPERHTCFGSIVEPMAVCVSELLAGAAPAKGEYSFIEKDRGNLGKGDEKARLSKAANFEYRRLRPNWDKPVAGESEMEQIDDFCKTHML